MNIGGIAYVHVDVFPQAMCLKYHRKMQLAMTRSLRRLESGLFAEREETPDVSVVEFQIEPVSRSIRRFVCSSAPLELHC